MKVPKFIDLLTDISGQPRGTAFDRVKELQAARIFTIGSRGPNGGIDPTPTDCINAILATALTFPRGVDVAEDVKRIRSLPLVGAVYCPLGGPALSHEDNIRSAFQFVSGLGICFDDLGATLDSLLTAMENGAYTKWQAGAVVAVAVDFHNVGQRGVRILIDRPQFGISAVFTFGSDAPAEAHRVERICRIPGEALAALAT